MTDQEIVESIYPGACCIKYQYFDGSYQYWILPKGKGILNENVIYSVLNSKLLKLAISSYVNKDTAWKHARIILQDQILKKLNV